MTSRKHNNEHPREIRRIHQATRDLAAAVDVIYDALAETDQTAAAYARDALIALWTLDAHIARNLRDPDADDNYPAA